MQTAGDDGDVSLVHDTYRLKLTGTNPSAQPVDGTTTFPGGLKVLTGSLSISGDAQTVTVPAGQCLRDGAGRLVRRGAVGRAVR